MDLVTVYRGSDPALFAFAKSLLEQAGVEYVTRGEALQNLFGVGTAGFSSDLVAGPVEIQVRDIDAQRARDLLADLDSPAR
jgi:hypothetical protein